jgi:hypothetical protein
MIGSIGLIDWFPVVLSAAIIRGDGMREAGSSLEDTLIGKQLGKV